MSDAIFRYVALDSAGRKVRGTLHADSTKAVQSSLVRQGLVALRIAPASAGSARRQFGGVGLSRRRIGEFLHDLGALAEAGVSIRAALTVMASGDDQRADVRRLAVLLEKEIASGASLSDAFSTALGARAGSISGMIAAAESSGNLGGALSRAADTLEDEIAATDSIISALSYPAFVLFMTVVAMLVILVAVVPALTPLMDETKGALPLPMKAMFLLSGFLTNHAALLATSGGLVLGLLIIAWTQGWIRKPLETSLLDGPAAALARGIVFGGVISVFGSLLAARIPASEALRLASRTSHLAQARDRLEPCVSLIREGWPISRALTACKGMPKSVARLAAIGEEAGMLGGMVQRAGKLERQRALRRIQSIAGWLGPVLIILLGALIGLILGSLLTSVSALGDAASAS